MAPAVGAALAVGSNLAPAFGPQPGDRRVWTEPRPPLPREVADVLYGTPEPGDSVVVRRLRAMIDSLNGSIDSMRQERRLPTWTTEVAGKKFGMDSQYIHIAGLKIPTIVLAFLPISLPQGNFPEAERAEQLNDMRDDLLRAAQRTETMNDFRRYVKELRARKQAERDAERRARQPPAEARRDSAKVAP
jgi:hypothetical protein